LGDGEDFELVFAVAPADARRLLAAPPVPGVPLTAIGEVVEQGLWLEERGRRRPLPPKGYVHELTRNPPDSPPTRKEPPPCAPVSPPPPWRCLSSPPPSPPRTGRRGAARASTAPRPRRTSRRAGTARRTRTSRGRPRSPASATRRRSSAATAC